MVRTKAGNTSAPAAGRKAVAARAPRKQLGHSNPVPTSPSGAVGKKPKTPVGGNPSKIWPKPTWQKGLQTFLSGGGGEGEGASSSSSSANTSLTSEPDVHSEATEGASGSGLKQTGTSNCFGTLLDDGITEINSDED